MKVWLAITLLFPTLCFAQKYRFGFSGALLSKEMTGVDKVTEEEGKLVSNTNFHYGVHFAYMMGNSLQFQMNHLNKNYSFDNTQEIIAGEEAFSITNTQLGFRWIALSRVAFRLLINFAEDLVFTVDSNNQAVLEQESLIYPSVFYDQIVFLGGTMYSGFKVGADIGGSGDTIENRQAVHYGVFAVLNAFEINYIVSNITKETESLDFTETESSLQFKYLFRF